MAQKSAPGNLLVLALKSPDQTLALAMSVNRWIGTFSPELGGMEYLGRARGFKIHLSEGMAGIKEPERHNIHEFTIFATKLRRDSHAVIGITSLDYLRTYAKWSALWQKVKGGGRITFCPPGNLERLKKQMRV